MFKKLFFVVVAVSSMVIAQNTSESDKFVETANSDDLSIVRAILDQCGLNDVTVQDVAITENGRVISLDLTNSYIAKDGISEIPGDIGKLTALRKLTLNNNRVTELPDEIGNLKELQELVVQSNSLIKLTNAIGRCANLTDLDLRHNQLESLPDEIGNLDKLVRLWLWGNKLTSLNETITRIKSLREIYLKGNRLTTLPASITKMNLDYFDVIGNKICKPGTALDAWLIKHDKRYRGTQKCW